MYMKSYIMQITCSFIFKTTFLRCVDRLQVKKNFIKTLSPGVTKLTRAEYNFIPHYDADIATGGIDVLMIQKFGGKNRFLVNSIENSDTIEEHVIFFNERNIS